MILDINASRSKHISLSSLLAPRMLKMNYNTSVSIAALLFVTTESRASNAHLAFSHMP